ncbi:MAG: hypothetical protein LBP59_08835 [Planctomycetaceae bacterium]|jgi:hypothetical protein|nr:hypothetical protein [Planctomycetaceae bacterium]
MKKKYFNFILPLSILLSAFIFYAACMPANTLGFENPLKKIFNNNNVEADPNKVYVLSEKDGPWLILLCSFKDKPTDKIKNSEEKANALVYELRKKFNLKAYVFAGKFNLNLRDDLKSDITLRNSDKSFVRNKKYNKGGSFIEYVVLVGDYQSQEELQKDLEKIRNISPECMFKMFPNAGKQQRPFPMPFAIPNPLLPKNYIMQSSGNLKIIDKLNEKREFSLLACPRNYTVQIATFTGRTVFSNNTNVDLYKNSKLPINENLSQLQLAELSAEKLCKALRAKGIEAYQYHDQFSSIVTVGGFDYCQTPGTNDIRPEIIQIMNHFKGKPIQTRQTLTPYSYIPVTIDGIECDMLPKIIEIPKRLPNTSQR